MVLLACLGTIAMIFLIFFDRDWKFNPANNNINAIDIYGSILLFLAAVIIAALAVALSCRFNIVVTLSACVGIFLLGLVSDWAFGDLQKHTFGQKYAILPFLTFRSSGLAMPFTKAAPYPEIYPYKRNLRDLLYGRDIGAGCSVIPAKTGRLIPYSYCRIGQQLPSISFTTAVSSHCCCLVQRAQSLQTFIGNVSLLTTWKPSLPKNCGLRVSPNTFGTPRLRAFSTAAFTSIAPAPLF